VTFIDEILIRMIQGALLVFRPTTGRIGKEIMIAFFLLFFPCQT
jgi:hypothetical protein